LRQYADALAVAYVPYDEDFGYVTLEGFLARKPVITAADSGGTLEFVVNDVNGAVVAPDAEAIAAAINRYAAARRTAAAHGDNGWARARQITWDGVIEKLVSA
jgi:glycosyltransferase involved in cell wall biosynthesis